MKVFFYKTLFIAVVVFILFRVLIGSLVNDIETKIENFQSKENIELIKDKARDEMRNAIEKEDYINDEDALLIKKFIEKIKQEIK
tara:strand:- start:470 stop:724 length:255 start_codon:yes stop_codon:yes gene_type:complete